MESLLFLAEKALDSKDFSNDFDVECLILARSKLISLCNCKFGGDISSEFNNLLSNNDEESFFYWIIWFEDAVVNLQSFL